MGKTILAIGTLASAAIVAVVSSKLPGSSDNSCPKGFSVTETATLARELRPDISASEISALQAEHGERFCLNQKNMEPAYEIMAANAVLSRGVGTPAPGAYRAALEQKAKLSQNKVNGANGHWSEYGQGPLLDDPARGGLGLGNPENMGRVDSFAYDPEHNRLFALVGTGGVWMSEADDVRELGDYWVPIGDNMPTLINGAVEWTTAGGGRLVVVSGESLTGGNSYSGMGAFWSDDLGQTWHQANGVPDSALGFEIAVDKSSPNIVYAATSKGLYRSTDAGSNYVNVNLPTSPECAGATDFGPCQFANFVTDVVVKEPGGVTGEAGGEVLAAVGYRGGRATFPDGTVHAPGNGLYRSNTGEVDSFERLNVSGNGLSNIGFAPPERIGRTELGIAYGENQNHNIVYATVQDAVLFNGGVPVLDMPDGVAPDIGRVPAYPTSFNGLYVSLDFGDSWMRLADDNEIAANPLSGSSFIALVALYAPGSQAWYNQWVLPDPTRQDMFGTPTRLAFGLEEVWQSKTTTGIGQDGLAQAGLDDYRVIGTFFAGQSCQLLNIGVTACPTHNPITTETTTHPDQHDGIYIPTGDGGVCLFAANDGGVHRQCVAAGEEMDNSKWGRGANRGFYTLLPYGFAAAADGRVWFGLQDNGSGYIDAQTREQFQNLGGDGFYAAVDKNQSDYAWVTTQMAGLNVTTDGGLTYRNASPPISAPNFANYFVMDPTDPLHVMTAGPEVVVVTDGPGLSWVEVFNLGTNADNGRTNTMTTIDLYGANAYVGFCAPCDLLNTWGTSFQNGIATNVGGDKPPAKGRSDGWHFAAAKGLPERMITSIAMDHQNPKTVFVALSGYYNRSWMPPGSYLDSNESLGEGNVFVSHDAGETFTNISGDLPAAHARGIIQRGNQLIVATDHGAFISSDLQGSSWAPLGDNLPNSPMTQVQLKPGDPNTLFASTYGRGIWSYEFPAEARLEPFPEVSTPPAAPRGGATPMGMLIILASFLVLRRRQLH